MNGKLKSDSNKEVDMNKLFRQKSIFQMNVKSCAITNKYYSKSDIISFTIFNSFNLVLPLIDYHKSN